MLKENRMRALGTVIDMPEDGVSPNEYYVGLLDYYDHWRTIDSRLQPHHDQLSPLAWTIGCDIVHMATYIHEILARNTPEGMWDGASLVTISAMTEGFLVTCRSCCDAIGQALSYVACAKPGQAPTDGLRALADWAEKNPGRVHSEVLEVLSGDLDWFWKVRTIRDYIVHLDAHVNIFTDREQYYLWVHSSRSGWITREPLLPLLARKLTGLTSLANEAAGIINRIINMPVDRVGSRTVSGIFIPSLHKLIEIAPNYAKPWNQTAK
jgi:hypothetical protein